MPPIAHAVALAPLTTLELGGAAEHFVEIEHEADLADALVWARDHGCAVTVLGGGSNVVVADAGVAGLVVRMATRGVVDTTEGDTLRLRALAGETWDDVVLHAIDRGASGIECLSGIPGSVGATPIQNVGAYGQEIADVVERVRVLERATGTTRWLARDACGFGYRTSVFKRAPHEHIVLEVEYALRRGPPAAPRYAELARALASTAPPSLAEIRANVLALRRGKSMVIDPHDDNRRSVGSFFTNPIVSIEQAADVEARAPAGVAVPQWPQPDGRIKLAAAWLIEHSGTARGQRRGAVGISSRHTLALVHHGGGTTRELLALAREVGDRVLERWGVALALEPVVLGA
jgi:UDP-N-acetylmuramate dehydrogenase